MSEDAAEQSQLGDELIAAGWRQGSIFQAAGLCFAYNDLSTSEGVVASSLGHRAVKSKECFILITQDCDIVAKPDDERYVEALICERQKNQEHLTRLDRNSARRFVVDREQGLVAQAKYRVQLTKRMLATLTPEPWPSDSMRFDRFVRWLARRYDRPAIPDALVKAFQQPVQKLFDQLDDERPELMADFGRLVPEIRINPPEHEEPPYELTITVLITTLGLSLEQADALTTVEREIRGAIDPSLVKLRDIGFKTAETVSYAEILATRPIFFEYLTYRGDEISGVEPFRRT